MNVSTTLQQIVRNPGSSLIDGHQFFDDFHEAGFTAGGAAVGKFSQTADAGVWLTSITQAGAGNATVTVEDDAAGGWLKLLNDAADNDLINCQLNGESFKLDTGKPLVAEWRIRVADVSETDWSVGLAISDVDIGGGVTDGFGFFGGTAAGVLDSDVNINAWCGLNSTNTFASNSTNTTKTDTGIDTADATVVLLQVVWDGVGKLRFYVDGNLKATHTDNLPTDEALSPYFYVRNDGAVAQSLSIDYIATKQAR